MADVVLGRGNQTYVYTRSPGGSDDAILDFKSIYYFAFLNGAGAFPSTSDSGTAEIEFALNFLRDRLTLVAQGTGLDFGGQTVDTADDVTAFQLHQVILDENGNIVTLGDVVFGVIDPNSDLNGDLVITAGTGTVLSAWDAAEGANGATLLTQLANLDAGLVYADIHLNGVATSSIGGRVLKQDNGNDLIDVSSLNISDYATILALLKNFPGATLTSEAVLQTFLDGISSKLTLKGTTIAGLNPEDFVFSTASTDDTFDGTANRDDLFGGGGNDTLNGGGDIDRLFGESGNDILDGGEGSDIMYGGTGNDTFYVDTKSETVSDAEGIDTIISTVDWNLGAAFENLTLNGTADLKGNGNDADNTIVGNSGSNVLQGLRGNDTVSGGDGIDTLFGNSGNDFLDGGKGADIMNGATGNDTYRVDSVGDVILDNHGIDTILSKINIASLAANIENVIMEGNASYLVIGNSLNNAITGNGGNNGVRGMAGNDTLNGAGGNDQIIGGLGRDILTGGLGADAFHFDAAAESRGALRDIVTDFEVGIDDLDFNTMDANLSLAGNQNFAFRGTGAFTGAGQLRVVKIDLAGTANDKTIVQGNLDGNLSTVEFEVELSGLHNLTAGDFVL